jgi:hypothetical protein
MLGSRQVRGLGDRARQGGACALPAARRAGAALADSRLSGLLSVVVGEGRKHRGIKLGLRAPHPRISTTTTKRPQGIHAEKSPKPPALYPCQHQVAQQGNPQDALQNTRPPAQPPGPRPPADAASATNHSQSSARQRANSKACSQHAREDCPPLGYPPASPHGQGYPPAWAACSRCRELSSN